MMGRKTLQAHAWWKRAFLGRACIFDQFQAILIALALETQASLSLWLENYLLAGRFSLVQIPCAAFTDYFYIFVSIVLQPYL